MTALPERLTSTAASITSPAATPLGVVIVSEVAEADVEELETVSMLGNAPRAGEEEAIATPAKSASATAAGQYVRTLRRRSAPPGLARLRLRNVVRIAWFPSGQAPRPPLQRVSGLHPPMRTDGTSIGSRDDGGIPQMGEPAPGRC